MRLASYIIQRKYTLILILLVLITFVLMGYAALTRHWSLSSYHFDLGNMHQTVYNTAHGRFLEMTDPNEFLQISRLAYHFDPLLALFVPLYWIYPGAEWLIIVQAMVLVLGAIPVYLLAAKVLKKRGFGLLFALLYLLYFPMHSTAIADFHAVVLSTSFLLWMFYLAEEKRFKASLIFFILALLTKENVTLVTAFFGLYHLLIKKNKVYGIGIFIVSLIVFVTVLKVIIPSFRPSDIHFAEGYYSKDILVNFSRFFRKETFTYFTMIFGPLGFLSLLSPLHLLIALPEFLINVLSQNANMRSLQYHYTALLTPFIFISAIYGVARIKKFTNVRITACVLVIMLMISLGVSLKTSPVFLAKYRINQQELSTVRAWQEILKDDTIKVAASGHLSPYFAGRQFFYNFFFDFAYTNLGYSEEKVRSLARHYQMADYVLIKRSEIDNHPLVLYYYYQLITDPTYPLIFNKHGIEVYKRNGIPERR